MSSADACGKPASFKFRPLRRVDLERWHLRVGKRSIQHTRTALLTTFRVLDDRDGQAYHDKLQSDPCKQQRRRHIGCHFTYQLHRCDGHEDDLGGSAVACHLPPARSFRRGQPSGLHWYSNITVIFQHPFVSSLGRTGQGGMQRELCFLALCCRSLWHVLSSTLIALYAQEECGGTGDGTKRVLLMVAAGLRQVTGFTVECSAGQKAGDTFTSPNFTTISDHLL